MTLLSRIVVDSIFSVIFTSLPDAKVASRATRCQRRRKVGAVNERIPRTLPSNLKPDGACAHTNVDDALRAMVRAALAMPVSPGLAGMIRLFAAGSDDDFPIDGAGFSVFAAQLH